MSILASLHHVTRYTYDRPIFLGPQVVRLRPAPHSRTRVLSYSMKVTPAKHFINWQQDPQSNYMARLVFPDKSEELRIEVDLVAGSVTDSQMGEDYIQNEFGVRAANARRNGPKLFELVNSRIRTSLDGVNA